MRVLVTGTTGFIGSHLIRTLTEMGHDCVGMDDLSTMGYRAWIEKFQMDNSNVRFVVGPDGNCCNPWNIEREMKALKPDIVYHLAVKPLPHSIESPIENYLENTEMMNNLIAAILDYPARLVAFSSSEVYGTSRTEMMDESHPMCPTTTYAAAKAANDHLVMSMCKMTDLDAVIVRPFNTYGPGQNENTYSAVIPKTVKRLMDGERPQITGDGKQSRDFTFVSDIIEGAILATEKGRAGEVYNLCSGIEVSINDLVDEIETQAGINEPPIHTKARISDVMRHCGSNAKARRELGWKPLVTLQDGIKETLKWYRE